MNVEIIRMAPDGLSRQVWWFHLCGRNGSTMLRLYKWAKQIRKTNLSKWKYGGAWWVIPDPAYPRIHYSLPSAEVPLPSDVIEEARARMVAWIPVMGPSGLLDLGR